MLICGVHIIKHVYKQENPLIFSAKLTARFGGQTITKGTVCIYKEIMDRSFVLFRSRAGKIIIADRITNNIPESGI